jgi:glycosyltransferase involved in cell wall biosynthesis
MNIVHLIDSGGLYGAEIVMLNLAAAQVDAAHQVCIISVGSSRVGEKAVEKEAIKRGFCIYSLRFMNGPNIIGAIKILKVARRQKAQVIHSHGYKGNILMAMLPSFIRKIPVFSTLHGWTSTKKWSRMWIYERTDILALKRLQGVVCVSQTLANNKIFHRAGIYPHFIPNGIPELIFSTKPPQNLTLKHKQDSRKIINLLNIGRLSREKGLDVLIDTIALLKDEKIIFRLYHVGDGYLKGDLTQKVNMLGLQKHVFFLGYQDNFYRFVPFFDIYIIPSLSEGLPITLLEIMQSGVPVISTRVGEIPNVLQNGKLGELVDPVNKYALAEKILEVSNSFEPFKIKALKAQEVAIQKYNLKLMVDSYFKIYNINN